MACGTAVRAPATESSINVKPVRINLDALGVCASTLCMFHCLMFSLLLAALPLWKLPLGDGDSVTAATVVDTSPAVDLSRAHVAAFCVDRDCRVQAASARSVVKGDDACAVCCTTPTDFWNHVGLLAAVAPLGIVAWGAGYRHHRRIGVLALGLLGVLLLCGALLFGHHLLGGRGEQVMTVVGSICMVTAHLWNRRQCRCCL